MGTFIITHSTADPIESDLRNLIIGLFILETLLSKVKVDFVKFNFTRKVKVSALLGNHSDEKLEMLKKIVDR